MITEANYKEDNFLEARKMGICELFPSQMSFFFLRLVYFIRRASIVILTKISDKTRPACRCAGPCRTVPYIPGRTVQEDEEEEERKSKRYKKWEKMGKGKKIVLFVLK